MLVIGNTHDGHTSLKSVHNASASWEAASFRREVNGYGHCSTKLISECTTRTTAAYFVNGTLPEKGMVCPVDVAPYRPLIEETQRVLDAMVKAREARDEARHVGIG
jgi:TAP-like protein